ncbi:MAG: ATP-binding protein [Trichlorobacter sp.]
MCSSDLDVGHGTGLGLSMVFGTIQQHGGIITASSKNGIGTIISIYLPLIVGTA